jgi:antitoxin component of MazEF toxin-antitoxin module
MNLGKKSENNAEKMFPTAVKEHQDTIIIHKEISLPLKLIKGLKLNKGDRVRIEVEGEITAMHDDQYDSSFTMKAEEGEVESDEDEEKEDEGEDTILGGEEKE